MSRRFLSSVALLLAGALFTAAGGLILYCWWRSPRRRVNTVFRDFGRRYNNGGRIHKLLSPRDAEMEYQDVVRALIGIGPGAVDILVEDLNAAGPEVRWRAAVALGHICDARAVDALCAALEDPDDQLRFFAAEALGRIGDPKAVEALLRMSRRDTGRVRVYWEDSLRGEWIDTPLRAVAVTALGAIGDERPVDSLLEILEDQGADPQVDTIYGKQAYPLRATVVQALGCIGSARARSALLAVANDDDFRVRQAAALALRRTQAGGDVEP